MSRSGQGRNATVVATTALAIALLVAPRLIVNVTPSVPLGFYWSHHLAPVRGDFVLIALPPHPVRSCSFRLAWRSIAMDLGAFRPH